MARTPSNMVPLGIKAPDFTLKDVVSSSDFNLYEDGKGKATLIMFICNHCPFVKHVLDGLIAIGRDYISKGVKVVAISPNDAFHYPDDSPVKMKELAIEKAFPFPYLYDESQTVAKVYDAACTPDFYIFDADLKLAYRGQLDDFRPGNNIPVTGNDIREALNRILLGKKVNEDQKPSLGCNIKWKQ